MYSDTLPQTKTATVNKSAQIEAEIWMTLPLEAKKWLLNEKNVNNRRM
jgi:hypothetical protein